MVCIIPYDLINVFYKYMQPFTLRVEATKWVVRDIELDNMERFMYDLKV